MANNSGSQNQPPGASATYPITTDPSVSHSKLPDSRERARNQIVAIWSDRLQLISVLSTFSTSIDSLLFSLSTTTRDHSNTGQLMSAAFAGALIFHAAGAVLAFLGAFVLIRYRLADARAHIPDTVHTAPPTFKSPPSAHTHGQSQRTHAAHAGHSHEKRHPSGHEHASAAATPLLTPGIPAEFAHPPLVRTPTFFERLLHVPFSLSSDITIELVRPWSSSSYRKRSLGLEIEPGSDLTKERLALKRMLQRCHHACSLFVLLGFLLLIVGVVSFAWEVLDRAVSIFVSSCVAFSILLGIYVLT